MITWDDAISPDDCGPITHYIATAVNLMDPSEVITREPTDNEHQFSDLKSSTLYSISVSAVNRAGNGPPAMRNITTKDKSKFLNSTDICMSGTAQRKCCKHLKLAHALLTHLLLAFVHNFLS